MDVLGLYYFISYVFTLSYFMTDKKNDRIFESTLLIVLFSALICVWTLPVVLSFALHKIVNSDNDTKK
jgi:hypothetical protein